ncbi:MAG: glycogen debranching enzyme GlgX [Frankiales bacterium]|nr:glycogen debranching enzyme GlgX [Frankiales bacterium]
MTASQARRVPAPVRRPSPGPVSGRIDSYPTHRHGDYGLRAGKPFPFGATLVPGGVNFSVFSSAATSVTLVIFEKGASQPTVEIPFPEAFRIGAVYSMTVFGLDVETVEYGYRMDGPFDPVRGHRFDPTRILMDPYARVIGGRDVWGMQPDWGDPYQHRARIAFDDFDWEDDRPLEVPTTDLVVYEAHVRGFTRHPSSGVKAPGTFAALKEKIPYLQELGINCLELMPVYEFDEFENSRTAPGTGEWLCNYWGYSTVGFFAPKAGFAATGRLGMQVDELKTLVKALHKAGIEVMLDVVFNHTAEGNEQGPYISFRGLDNKTYYMLTPEGYYFNFSGTGNTLNCNNPVVRNVVLDCLRYWAAEYHIDGFRFDLAAILGRDASGAPLSNPPLLETLAHDPVLARCKLVAEAWDAGGLYQVGSFPAYGRWAEWNGKYRDTVRRFLKGEPGQVGELATRMLGSPDLYTGRGTAASVNFVTAHDGFTLADLFAYDEKHNEANGEDNRDGANDNDSWNHGVEGPTDDPAINALRARQVRNAFVLLLTSQGIPMIVMGDEIGRTQLGNNNMYCHDNELAWLDWTLADRNADLLRFVRELVAFRAAHPVLRGSEHVSGNDADGDGLPDASFHGMAAWEPDWSPDSRVLGLLRSGSAEDRTPDVVYLALNAHWETHGFQLPQLPGGLSWHVFANTSVPAPGDVHAVGEEPRLDEQSHALVGARSALVLVGR